MLEFEFMRRALIAGILLGIIVPLIGVVVVNRKTSGIGDALSHTSLVGISAGLILGFNPIIGAIIICIIAAFSIDSIRSKFPRNGDMITVIVMSAGIGLASIMSDFIPGSQNLERYIFGSILTVTNEELFIIAAIFFVVLFSFTYFYKALLYITISKTQARLSGVNTKLVDNVFTLILAVTIAVASKAVGALMVSSLMVLPVATSLTFSKSYFKTVLFSVVIGILDVVIGIILSYYLELKPGGTIVITGVITLILALAFNRIKYKR